MSALGRLEAKRTPYHMTPDVLSVITRLDRVIQSFENQRLPSWIARSGRAMTVWINQSLEVSA